MLLLCRPKLGTRGSALFWSSRQPCGPVMMPLVKMPLLSTPNVVPSIGRESPFAVTLSVAISIACSVQDWVDSDRRYWKVASMVSSLLRHWPAAA